MTNKEAIRIVIDVALKRKPWDRITLKKAVELLESPPEPKPKKAVK